MHTLNLSKETLDYVIQAVSNQTFRGEQEARIMLMVLLQLRQPTEPTRQEIESIKPVKIETAKKKAKTKN